MLNRILRGLRSFDRIGEVATCFRNVDDAPNVVLSFVGLKQNQYPIQVADKAGRLLTLYDFADLTTLWAVWCAGEYTIPRDSRVVLDLGANIGAFSLFALASAPGCRVVAVEPFPSTFEKLVKTVELNGLQGRVSCEMVAISDKADRFFMSSDQSIESHSRKVSAERGEDDAIEVLSMSIADILEKCEIDEIDYLKSDIEGAEVQLFDGTPEDVLRRARKIGVECHSAAGQATVWGKLDRSGFKLDRVTRGSHYGNASTAEFTRR